jgi:pimeloyl-ACP methyl ester carboxylesterase
MSRIIVAGEMLHYRLHEGDSNAPPLVLVHGAGGNLMHWPGELRRLGGTRVYALDLPGHGKSGGPGRAEIDAYVEVVREFAEKLGLPRFVLGGHSMGSAIAQTFALHYGARLAGLVLVGGGAKLRVAPQILTGVLQEPVATAALLAEWTHAEGTDPNLLRLYRRRLQEVPVAVMHGDFVACDRFDRRADVGQIAAPTLIICGAADRMTPVKYSEFLRDAIPEAELVIVPGAGHMVMLEQPAAVTAAVQRFLRRLR